MIRKLLFVLFTLVCTTACSDDVIDFTGVSEHSRLRILCVGSSLTKNSMDYVPRVLASVAPGTDVTIGVAYLGGAELAQHLACASGKSLQIQNKWFSPQPYTQFCISLNGAPWKKYQRQHMKGILRSCKWDVILLQSNADTCTIDMDVTIAPVAAELQRCVTAIIGGREIKWGVLFIPSAYATSYEGFEQVWDRQREATRRIGEVIGACMVLPGGTALQNLRTTRLRELGQANMSEPALTADGCHVNEGVGKLAMAYANGMAICDYLGITSAVLGDSMRLDEYFLRSINYLKATPDELRDEVVGITPENCRLAQLAAMAAFISPYEITDMSSVEASW